MPRGFQPCLVISSSACRMSWRASWPWVSLGRGKDVVGGVADRVTRAWQAGADELASRHTRPDAGCVVGSGIRAEGGKAAGAALGQPVSGVDPVGQGGNLRQAVALKGEGVEPALGAGAAGIVAVQRRTMPAGARAHTSPPAARRRRCQR